MKIQDVFVLITTDKMFECRDFYARHFGFEVVFQSTIYLQMSVSAEKENAFSLAFMPPDHPFSGVGPELFTGQGLLLTIQVADAGAMYEQLKTQGAPITYNLRDEAWGQRRFMTKDPAGTRIDVVQPIETAPGYYDPYTVQQV